MLPPKAQLNNPFAVSRRKKSKKKDFTENMFEFLPKTRSTWSFANLCSNFKGKKKTKHDHYSKKERSNFWLCFSHSRLLLHFQLPTFTNLSLPLHSLWNSKISSQTTQNRHFFFKIKHERYQSIPFYFLYTPTLL